MEVISKKLLLEAIKQASANVCLEPDIVFLEKDEEEIESKVLIMEKSKNG